MNDCSASEPKNYPHFKNILAFKIACFWFALFTDEVSIATNIWLILIIELYICNTYMNIINNCIFYLLSMSSLEGGL